VLFVCILLFAHCCGCEVRDIRIATLRFFRTLCRACYWSPAEKLRLIKTIPGSILITVKEILKGCFSSAHPDAYDEAKIKHLLSITDSLL